MQTCPTAQAGRPVHRSGYMAADAHAHIYMDRIAQRALEQIVSFYGMEELIHAPEHAGTVDHLVAHYRECGISAALVSEAAHRPALVEMLNDFIFESCRRVNSTPGAPHLLGLCTVHPDCENIPDILADARRRGFSGVKIHPDYQEFDMDDPRCNELYDFCRQEHFPVLIHCGDARYDYSSPRRLQNVIDRFPGIPVIAAHLGGYQRWDESINLRPGENTFFDTCSSLFALPPEKAAAFFEKFGYERFFFGSDYPLFQPDDEIGRFLSLGLPDKWNEHILYRNFARAFALPQ